MRVFLQVLLRLYLKITLLVGTPEKRLARVAYLVFIAESCLSSRRSLLKDNYLWADSFPSPGLLEIPTPERTTSSPARMRRVRVWGGLFLNHSRVHLRQVISQPFC